jgi:hypothetical protein
VLPLLAPLVVSSSPAFGWADVGHRVVCEIAFLELTGEARATVERLVEAHDDFDSFSDACTWADALGRERKDEHYINVLRDSDGIRTESCDPAQKCLFSAIRKDSGDVSNESHSASERAEALAYLGHWIGDIHQPLHLAFQDDKGGNDVRQSGSCLGSLHLVWDLCIIEEGLGSDARSIARAMHASVSDSERAEWRDSTAVEWAAESYAVTTRETVSYCVADAGECWYEVDNERLDPGEAEKTVVVDAPYLELQLPTVRERLRKAGIRLGALLNALLGPAEDRGRD